MNYVVKCVSTPNGKKWNIHTESGEPATSLANTIGARGMRELYDRIERTHDPSDYSQGEVIATFEYRDGGIEAEWLD